MDPFAALLADARAWLKRPDDAKLPDLSARAGAAAEGVPAERRHDWEKLVLGFAKDEAPARRKARVEGLVRACALFREKGDKPPAPPLSPEAPPTTLAGIGGKGAAALAEAGITSVGELVWMLPSAWDDLRAPLSVKEALARVAVPTTVSGGPPPRLCIRGVVKASGLVPMRGRRSVRVVVADETDPAATIHAWWFFAAHGVLSLATVGTPCLLVGRVRKDPGKPARTAHPDLLRDEPAARGVRPRYARIGVPEAILRKTIREGLDRLTEIPDPVPPEIARREGMAPAGQALAAAHAHAHAHVTTDGPPDTAAIRAAFDRLAWAEAFTRVWARVRLAEGRGAAPVLPERPDLLARLRAELGFPLTRGQDAAIADIAKELARKEPMRRLLLGDVGTGKTAVALAAAAQCVGAHAQVAILAPTSVLAEQYMDAVAPLARATGASIALVSAGQGAAERKRATAEVARGAIDVAIGTHALLDEGVAFARLGLVIVDEQHRLGVAQRLALVRKGTRPHLLTLSATPIPRTLALALRGELDTSILSERPRGRPPVATETRWRGDTGAILRDIREACARGERVFFISPRIEVTGDDDDLDESSGAVARADELARALSPVPVVLVHGGLPPEAKRRAMRAFRSGEAQVLVGTTVVEVGVDVPEATLMLIDGAERFGLAQLHQMRGRVGRGDVPGRCVLLHEEPVAELARQRLNALCTLSDGAAVARADLELRGAGDLSGTRQHGAAEELVFLDPAQAPPWLGRIEADARAILAEDPSLARPEHRFLGATVRRFGHAIAVREEAG